jgi:hypothetical protein
VLSGEDLGLYDSSVQCGWYRGGRLSLTAVRFSSFPWEDFTVRAREHAPLQTQPGHSITQTESNQDFNCPPSPTPRLAAQPDPWRGNDSEFRTQTAANVIFRARIQMHTSADLRILVPTATVPVLQCSSPYSCMCGGGARGRTGMLAVVRVCEWLCVSVWSWLCLCAVVYLTICMIKFVCGRFQLSLASSPSVKSLSHA